MRLNRFVRAVAALFVFAVCWNAVIHLVVLRTANATVAHLRRSDFDDQLWLSLLLTAAIVTLFVWGYHRFARNGTLREGVTFGLFFALVAGSLVDLNQYLLYPIPGWVAISWFLAGLVEFVLYGVLLSRLYPASRK